MIGWGTTPPMYVYIYIIPKLGVSLTHLCSKDFHILNHPAIEVPPFLETFIYVFLLILIIDSTIIIMMIDIIILLMDSNDDRDNIIINYVHLLPIVTIIIVAASIIAVNPSFLYRISTCFPG